MRNFLPISIVFHILLFLYIGKNTDVKPHLHTIEVDVIKRVLQKKAHTKTQIKNTQRKYVKVEHAKKKRHYWNTQRKPDYPELGQIRRKQRLVKYNFSRHKPNLLKPGKAPVRRKDTPPDFSEAVQLTKRYLVEDNKHSFRGFKLKKTTSRQKYILHRHAKARAKKNKYRLVKQNVPVSTNNMRNSDKTASFRQLVIMNIEKNKKYPILARRRGIEGSVLIKFFIKENGSVSDVQIIKSSGHSMLDKSAVKGVFSAAPFPSPPAAKEGVWFKFRLSFALT